MILISDDNFCPKYENSSKYELNCTKYESLIRKYIYCMWPVLSFSIEWFELRSEVFCGSCLFGSVWSQLCGWEVSCSSIRSQCLQSHTQNSDICEFFKRSILPHNKCTNWYLVWSSPSKLILGRLTRSFGGPTLPTEAARLPTQLAPAVYKLLWESVRFDDVRGLENVS